MHILDLIMYFVTAVLLWFLMDKIGGGDYTQELGGVIGATIMVIYTIVYIVLFVIGSYNWIDIFHEMFIITFNITL